MGKVDNIILKDLFESVDGLFAFTLYSRHKIEPDRIIDFIHKYKTKGIISFESNKINLTKEGREIILKQLFLKELSGDKFSNIPSDFIVSKLNINEPYLPNIKTVSADILKK